MALEINRVNTSYTTDGRRLTVYSPMMTTIAAWLPDSPSRAPLAGRPRLGAPGWIQASGNLHLSPCLLRGIGMSPRHY